MTSDKRAARAEARRRLSALDSEARRDASEAIARRIWDVPEVRNASSLLLYADLPGEVATDAIAAEARRRGVAVVYPRCLPDTRAMTLHPVDAPDALAIDGAYGIREPSADCPIVDPREIDVALLPGLAWDRRGGRLGRGAGYYDRLMTTPGWRAVRCGVYFAAQEAPSLPTDPWDVPLDLVVTEREVWRRVADGRSSS